MESLTVKQIDEKISDLQSKIAGWEKSHAAKLQEVKALDDHCEELRSKFMRDDDEAAHEELKKVRERLFIATEESNDFLAEIRRGKTELERLGEAREAAGSLIARAKLAQLTKDLISDTHPKLAEALKLLVEAMREQWACERPIMTLKARAGLKEGAYGDEYNAVMSEVRSVVNDNHRWCATNLPVKINIVEKFAARYARWQQQAGAVPAAAVNEQAEQAAGAGD